MRSLIRLRCTTTLVVVVVLLAAAGCGSASSSLGENATTVDAVTVEDPTTSSSPATTAPDPGWASPTTEALHIKLPAGCPMPWAPVYVEQTAYPAQSLTSTGTKPAASGPRPNRLNSTQDPQVSLLARAYSGFDQGASQGNDVVIGKGDQAITIGGKNLNVYLPGGKTWIGDLNGDGHDDIAVASTTGDASSGQQPMVLISGTVGPGAHDPFAVGVRLPASADQGQAFGVGDINGDGADDVAMASGSQTVIVSGRDVMAPGPGGRIDQIPAPIAVVPANDGGWFTLAPKTYPVLARVNGASLEFVTTPTVSLRIDGDPAALLSSPEISGYLSHGHRIIVAKYDSGRSGMTQTEMWNLDAPCSSTK